MNYKSIEIKEKYLSYLPTRIIITLEDDTTKEIVAKEKHRDDINQNECFRELLMFSRMENKTISELESVGKIIINLSKETEQPKVEKPKVAAVPKKEEKETKKEPETVKPKTAKSDKDESSKKKKRVGAWIATLVVALGVGYGANELINAIKNGNFRLHREQPKYTLSDVISTGKKDNNKYVERLDGVIKNGQEVGEGLVTIRDGKMVSYDEFLEMLNSQKVLAYANMDNVSEYLNNKELTGDRYVPDFTVIYEQDTNEHAVVNHFNGLRNSIVHLAYDGKDKKEIKAAVKEFEEKFVKFVLGDGNNALEINGKYYTFNQLSPSAQYTIVQIGMGVLTIQQDFKIEVDGVTYNRMTAIEEVANLEVDVFKELKAKQKIR